MMPKRPTLQVKPDPHNNVDTVSTVSRVSDNGDEAGPNHPSSGLEQAL